MTMNALQRRLLPLNIGVALDGFLLWLPIEKLFMSEIGFTPATIGLMAAAYAVIVPILEVPSGILADRWTRRGVLVVATAALALCELIGGLSHNVGTYIVSALVLGVYFAMYSGTVDAMVYDTVVEETGDGAGFEKRIGRVRFVEGVSLVVSSLAGGWVASLLPLRAVYFLTIPFTLAAIVAYLRFREPNLHRANGAVPLREHVATTFRALTRQRSLLPAIALSVIAGVLLQAVYEFGPLWLVAVSAPAVLFGPYWAGLVSTTGLGALLAGRLNFNRPATVAGAGGLVAAAAMTLSFTRDVVVITLAQAMLGLLLTAITVHMSQVLHDAVQSNVRAGVASGVSTFTWLVFLPFSLIFGWVSDKTGVHAAALLLAGGAVLVTGLLAVTARRRPPRVTDPQPALAAA